MVLLCNFYSSLVDIQEVDLKGELVLANYKQIENQYQLRPYEARIYMI